MIDSLAFGSDAPRSWKQFGLRSIARSLAACVGTGPFATELAQCINPVCTINTPAGSFVCRGGHGRLVWRAKTFLTEEPDTVAWLDSITPRDILWDVGANVGLYSIYAALFRGCMVAAFEPEAQNYTLLMDNIALNPVCKRRITASNLAIAENAGFNNLHVRYVTKGGAFNSFGDAPTDSLALAELGYGLKQYVFGSSPDILVKGFNWPEPTHIKIDVDGLEPQIIAGSKTLLGGNVLRSVLVELNMDSEIDMRVPAVMESFGFKSVKYGEGKPSTKRKSPMANWIFER